jgi:hypothetical protein
VLTGVTTLLGGVVGGLWQECGRNCWAGGLERAGDLLRCSLAEVQVDVGVQVRGDGDLGVAQPLGDHLQRDAGVQRQAGIGVAQVVELNYGQARLLGQRLEVPGGVLGSQPQPRQKSSTAVVSMACSSSPASAGTASRLRRAG